MSKLFCNDLMLNEIDLCELEKSNDVTMQES